MKLLVHLRRIRKQLESQQRPRWRLKFRYLRLKLVLVSTKRKQEAVDARHHSVDEHVRLSWKGCEYAQILDAELPDDSVERRHVLWCEGRDGVRKRRCVGW